MTLDEQDRRLLRILQADGRISNQDLAERAGLSTSSCWRRVRSLEDAGVIQAYGARLDPAACGLTFQAIVHIQLQRHDPDLLDSFVAAMQQREEVLSCYATTGEADYHLHVLCRDLDAYNEFLESFIFRTPGVLNARTNLILKPIKEATAVPM